MVTGGWEAGDVVRQFRVRSQGQPSRLPPPPRAARADQRVIRCPGTYRWVFARRECAVTSNYEFVYIKHRSTRFSHWLRITPRTAASQRAGPGEALGSPGCGPVRASRKDAVFCLCSTGCGLCARKTISAQRAAAPPGRELTQRKAVGKEAGPGTPGPPTLPPGPAILPPLLPPSHPSYPLPTPPIPPTPARPGPQEGVSSSREDAASPPAPTRSLQPGSARSPHHSCGERGRHRRHPQLALGGLGGEHWLTCPSFQGRAGGQTRRNRDP